MREALAQCPALTPAAPQRQVVLRQLLAGGKTVQEVLEAYPEIELVRRSTPVTGQGVWAPCGW